MDRRLATLKQSLSICCTMFQHWINAERFPVSHLCVNTLPASWQSVYTQMWEALITECAGSSGNVFLICMRKLPGFNPRWDTACPEVFVVFPSPPGTRRSNVSITSWPPPSIFFPFYFSPFIVPSTLRTLWQRKSLWKINKRISRENNSVM